MIITLAPKPLLSNFRRATPSGETPAGTLSHHLGSSVVGRQQTPEQHKILFRRAQTATAQSGALTVPTVLTAELALHSSCDMPREKEKQDCQCRENKDNYINIRLLLTVGHP